MWGRWCCSSSAGFRSFTKRVSEIVNLTHGYDEKVQSFGSPLLGLRSVVTVTRGGGGGGRGKGFEYFSVMFNQMKRGLSSSSSNVVGDAGNGNGDRKENPISSSEAKKLMRLVNVETLKMELGMEGKEIISYFELLQACQSSGIARNQDEAAKFAKVLDDAGVVLLFRDKVYLHPDKVRVCCFNSHFFTVLFSS